MNCYSSASERLKRQDPRLRPPTPPTPSRLSPPPLPCPPLPCPPRRRPCLPCIMVAILWRRHSMRNLSHTWPCRRRSHVTHPCTARLLRHRLRLRSISISITCPLRRCGQAICPRGRPLSMARRMATRINTHHRQASRRQDLPYLRRPRRRPTRDIRPTTRTPIRTVLHLYLRSITRCHCASIMAGLAGVFLVGLGRSRCSVCPPCLIQRPCRPLSCPESSQQSSWTSRRPCSMTMRIDPTTPRRSVRWGPCVGLASCPPETC